MPAERVFFDCLNLLSLSLHWNEQPVQIIVWKHKLKLSIVVLGTLYSHPFLLVFQPSLFLKLICSPLPPTNRLISLQTYFTLAWPLRVFCLASCVWNRNKTKLFIFCYEVICSAFWMIEVSWPTDLCTFESEQD